MNDFVVVIPSRLGSSRLKEKPLIDIAGKSLIQRVYERVQLCSTDQIYICLLYTSPSPRDPIGSRMPSSA